MIGESIRLGCVTLMRDRVALALTFALPIVFFSLFAMIFGNQRGTITSGVKLSLVDEDQTEASRRFADALRADGSLVVRYSDVHAGSEVPYSRKDVEQRVREGKDPIALVLLPGFGERVGNFFENSEPAIEMFVDQSDPVARPIVTGIIQKVAMTSAPDLMMRRGLGMLEKFGGALTPAQTAAVESFSRLIAADRKEAESNENAADPQPAAEKPDADPFSAGGPVPVKAIDVLGAKKRTPMIGYYAAAIAVMFLLFSVSGASGSLLEEQDNGTLDRLLCSRMTLTQLLAGKWLLITLIGIVQVIVMFLWGWAVFGLTLFTPYHLTGFAIMTLATAASASAFGLLLATACRSRAQLSGLATVVILIMSAMGGSMFPRFLMPEWMQAAGLGTFNAWALEGYVKIFWREQPLIDILPQVAVLATFCVACLAGARLLARRWAAV